MCDRVHYDIRCYNDHGWPALDYFLSIIGSPQLRGIWGEQCREVLERILKYLGLRASRTAIFRGIYHNIDCNILERIITAGCERRRFNDTSEMEGINMEVIQAVRWKNPAAMEMLLRNGYDVDTRDSEANGRTALYFAIDIGWKEGVEVLLRNGADVKAVVKKDGNEVSAWDIAKWNRNATYPRKAAAWEWINVCEEDDKEVEEMVRARLAELGFVNLGEEEEEANFGSGREIWGIGAFDTKPSAAQTGIPMDAG